MISFSVDVPFSIGDEVMYEYLDYQVDSVECPFCHGKGSLSINNVMEYLLVPMANRKDSSAYAKAVFSRECANCKEGKIPYMKKVSKKQRKVKIVGIAYCSEVTTELRVMGDGEEFIVSASSLHAINKEE